MLKLERQISNFFNNFFAYYHGPLKKLMKNNFKGTFGGRDGTVLYATLFLTEMINLRPTAKPTQPRQLKPEMT